MTCTFTPTCRVGKGQRHREGCPGAIAARRTKGGAHKTDRARVSVPLLEELCAAMGVPCDGTPNDMVRAMLAKCRK